MIDNISLDIFIGLIFIYLLYSLLATVIMEIIAQHLKLRGRMLKKAIRVMLEDRGSDMKDHVKTLADAFYEHPSIKYLAEEDSSKSKPSYIEAQNFSSTLISILRGRGYDGTSHMMDRIYDTLFPQGKIETGDIVVIKTEDTNPAGFKIYPETLIQLRQLYVDANKDIDRFKSHLENWFKETMDRANGWYVKQTRNILFCMGLTLAICGNVDTIRIYNILATNNTARELLANMAVQSQPNYRDSNTDSLNKRLRLDIQQANKILGLGWGKSDSLQELEALKAAIVKQKQLISNPKIINDLRNQILTQFKAEAPTDSTNRKNWNQQIEILQYKNPQTEIIKKIDALQKKADNLSIRLYDRFWFWSIPGWIITAFAIMLGAPFWFDLMSKLICIRSAGAKPKKDDEAITQSNKASNYIPSITQRKG